MKDLKDAIYEASKKPLQFAKFENIPGKVLYNELVKGICNAYEKDIKNGYTWQEEYYNVHMKGVDSNKINPKATLLIVTFADIDFKNKSIKKYKWDGKRDIISDEALNETTKLFETYWDKPVINGVRQTTREANGVTPRGNNHNLIFKFPDGTKLWTNLLFGPLQKLLKYATEKNYESPNIPDDWWK